MLLCVRVVAFHLHCFVQYRPVRRMQLFDDNRTDILPRLQSLTCAWARRRAGRASPWPRCLANTGPDWRRGPEIKIVASDPQQRASYGHQSSRVVGLVLYSTNTAQYEVPCWGRGSPRGQIGMKTAGGLSNKYSRHRYVGALLLAGLLAISVHRLSADAVLVLSLRDVHTFFVNV